MKSSYLDLFTTQDDNEIMENISIPFILKSLETSYLNKKFDDGIDLLLKHKNLLDSGSFHYYFGSFHLKKNDFAVARYHLEKAVNDGYYDSGIFHNIDVAKSNLPSVSIEANQAPMDKALSSSLTLGSEYYLMFGLVLSTLFLLFFLKQWLEKWWITAIFVVLAFVPLIFKMTYLDSRAFALNFKEVKIKQGPSDIYDDIGSLPVGTKVILGKKYNGWYFIEAPKKLNGWVNKNKIVLY